jgi:hypothetical protein
MTRAIHQPALQAPLDFLEAAARRARLGVPEADTAILRGFTEAELNTIRMFVLSFDQPESVDWWQQYVAIGPSVPA